MKILFIVLLPVRKSLRSSAADSKNVEVLRTLAPDGTGFFSLFEEICGDSRQQKQFELQHNQEWSANIRMFVKAFLHAKFFLEMVVRYGKEFESGPAILPSGWAAVLCLYKIQ